MMFCPVSPKAGPEDQGNDRIRTLLLWLFSKFSQESQIMPVRKKWGDAVQRPAAAPAQVQTTLHRRNTFSTDPLLLFREALSTPVLPCSSGCPEGDDQPSLYPPPPPHPKVGSVSLEAGAQQCMVHSEDPVTRTLSLPTPGDHRPVRVPRWTGDSPADLVNTLRIDRAGWQSTRCGVSFRRRRVP